jgi:tRNA/rRNA methyltransferase
MKIVFILVRPVVPENIGFVCRAMFNMGFESLRIVDSNEDTKKGARNTAYKVHHLLENARHYEDLKSSTEDLDLIVGTTAKERRVHMDHLPVADLLRFLDQRKSQLSTVGIVFGSESDGLTLEEENLCHVLSTIPMAQGYPSMNLSHSLAIYAYELSKMKSLEKEEHEIPDPGRYRAFADQTEDFLRKLEIPTRQPGLYQQVRDRMLRMSATDIGLFMSVARYLRRRIR